MALKLHIPRCIGTRAHDNHPPPLEKPLRISIEGPLVAIQKILPQLEWHVEAIPTVFPQPAGPELARLTYQTLYKSDVRQEVAGDMVVQDEYLGWVTEARPARHIDYYGVTFDHLVPENDPDPEVLMINIIEIENDGGEYANKFLPFAIDSAKYTGKMVLAVPRCCQKRKGTQDRARVNSRVSDRKSHG